MLKRLLIENYRAITSLELHLGPKQLLLGRNGSGKTSIFDVLSAVRDLVVEGEKCLDVFPLSTVPRWLRSDKPGLVKQRVELDVEGEPGILRYLLILEQNERLGTSRIFEEELSTENGKPVFSFKEGKVQLYDDQGTDYIRPGPTYTHEWGRSALSSVLSGKDNVRLTWFRGRMRELHCVRIDAPRMSSRSEQEDARPARDLSNFASWYRHALVANASIGSSFLDGIREVIGGMSSLDLDELGQGIRVLRAKFDKPSEVSGSRSGKSTKTFSLDFSELSDGQRALIGLYALLYFMVRENATLCIDEPDNFVALAEIQPWLFGVQDRIDDLGAQVVIASHHPELLNLLAPEHGIVLERTGSGPTRAHRYSANNDSELSPAERVARGWERE
ncbi:MAG: AAA family ATPase [Phycisphaerales bacterium]|nr:AAA family ATPase [Phycisphaerales bacterium]